MKVGDNRALKRKSAARYYLVISSFGRRRWFADDENHAREQHLDAFPEERIISIEVWS